MINMLVMPYDPEGPVATAEPFRRNDRAPAGKWKGWREAMAFSESEKE